MTNKTYLSQSEEDTQKIAAEFAKKLRGGDIVFLVGDLGSGKTTFVRGVARALGYQEPVRSPTFTMINRYPVEHASIRQIVHVDLYRLSSVDELRPLALEETIGDPHTVAFIEWPDLIRPTISAPTWEILFAIDGDARTLMILHPQP